MVKVAKGKRAGKENGPQFYTMDMQEFDLGQKFEVVLSMFGGFGYLHTDKEVSGFLSRARKHLEHQGLLIFEFWHASGLDPEASTPAGRNRWLKITENDTGQVIIRLDWNKYDAQTNLLTMTFDHYILDPEKRVLLDAFSSTHATRVYSMPFSCLQEVPSSTL